MSTDTENMDFCEALWNEYEPKLRQLCQYKLASCPEEIDEAIGDAYLALCSAVSNGTELKNPKAWLFTITNNIIKLKYTEHNERKKNLVSFESVGCKLYYDIDFIDIKFTDEVLYQIKDEIYNELLPAEQTLLILIYTKKLKYKEIARILHSTEKAVKQRHYRLKRKIKQIAKEKLKNYN